MNRGTTVPPAGADPKPTTRQFISDFTVQLLADAYGYTVVLPSTIDTAHATLDSVTGTLLVQGRTGALNDMITLTVVGNNIQVVVNNTTELVPLAHVTQIVIAGLGGTDTITVDTALAHLRQDVQYVVSSNQDAVDNGTLGDGLVDLDAIVPGYQVALRAAIHDIGSGTGTIFVPRGNYNLDINGSGGITQGDLDITGHVTILGAGAGATVINAGSLTTADRVFEINGANRSLALSRMTLTGGNVTGTGGAISVTSGGALELEQVAVVGNQASGQGGGVYVGSGSEATVLQSVFTGNAAGTFGGGLISAGSTSSIALGSTIIAKNTAVSGRTDFKAANGATAIDLGNNLIGVWDVDQNELSAAQGNILGGNVDHVVTSVVDTINMADDSSVFSLREAVIAANAAGGTIWLPAWHHRLTRTGAETGNIAAVNDLDILDDVTIVGAGAGATIIDATAISDRVFEVNGANRSLALSRMTLTGGNVTGTGGAISVTSGGALELEQVAVVNNQSGQHGGAIYANNSTLNIGKSVFVGNHAGNQGGAIFVSGSTASLSDNVIAYNTASSGGDNLQGTFSSNGNNLLTNIAGSSGLSSDHVGTPDYVVTSVVDSFNHLDNAYALSLREAVDLANANDNVLEEIWMPGWKFVLTRDRLTYGDGSLTDIDAAFGDLDVTDSLKVRGVTGFTTVEWRLGVIDAVFDLLGDYNGTGLVGDPDNGTVNGRDFLTWQQQFGQGTEGVSFEVFSADGNDDGVVNGLDYDIWSDNYGNSLEILPSVIVIPA